MVLGPRPVSEEQVGDDVKKKKTKSKVSYYSCQVHCLDGSIIKSEVEKHSKGEVLFNKVVTDLAITEKEYVGLNFDNEKGIRLWLDIHKELKHQIGEHDDIVLNFRLKFYEPEPSRIKDVFLRYLFYLQLREDLIEGRLKSYESTYAVLGSYTVQAELGDFDLHTHGHDYLKDYMFAPEQTSSLIKRVHELHKEHRGQSPAQAEINFLEVAKKIPRYGVDIHKAKDNEGEVEIGVAAIGIYIYRLSRKEYLFRWQIVDTVQYNRRKYMIKVKEGVPKAGEESTAEDNMKSKKKPQLTFIYYFDSATKCKQCYKTSIECHTFFRLAKPDSPRKRTDSLKLGSSFRYSDRTLYQLRHRPNNDEDPATDVSFTRAFARTPSKRRSTDTPRGSWNPDDENFKDHDTLVLENGHILPLVDEEPQYEEIEIDEANPDDDKFDPEKWEVIERELPDGTVKRYRRRVIHVVPLKKKKMDESPIKTTPMMNEQYYADQDVDVPIQTYPESITPEVEVPVEEIPMMIESSVNVESEPILDLEEPKMYLEEVEIDETNPEDSWYDPSEWEVVERTLPHGVKKRYRVRLVEADVPIDADADVESMEMEEVEINENDPEDIKYDPKEWDVVERQDPDGTKKRFLRRYFIKTVKPVPIRPSNLLIDEPVIQIKEVDIDATPPEKFNPEEWQVAEVLTSDGNTKKVRRTILITHINIIHKKPSEIYADDPMGVLEELDLDEVVLDESHPEDMEYDPTEWEVCEKILPDGKRQVVRRRVLITKLQFINKRPCDIPSDEPLAIVEEVEVDQANLQQFDPNEWEVAEKELPDGTSKPVCRRVLVNHIDFVKRKPSEVGPNESMIAVEEIDIGEESPEDAKYDSSEWEVVDKTLPNGEIVQVRRRIVITRYKVFIKKPSEVDPSKPLTKIEEVEIDEVKPDYEKYNSDEWEVEEVVQPDGTSKYICRRLVISKVEYVYKRPSDVTIDEQPVAELEEVDVDEENQDHEKYNANEWELIEKTTPEGKLIRVYQRYIIRCVHITYKKPSDVPPDFCRSRVEEIEIDEEKPDDEKYDPNQWEIVEKSLGSIGKVKRVRRRIVESCVSVIHKLPSEISYENPLREAINDHDVDPKEWEVANITLSNGEEIPGRCRYLFPQVMTEYKKPSEVPASHPFAEVEEVESSPVCIDPNFDPDEWELTDKILPDGTTKPVHRRFRIKGYITEYKKPCDVAPEIPIAVIEEAEIELTHMEDDKLEPDGWETCEKTLPDGTTKTVRRRYILTCRQNTYKRPDDVTADMPYIEVEELLINEDKPEDDKYDPKEWDVIEKVTSHGKKMRYRCRIMVTKVAKVYYKPSDISPDDLEGAEIEEVDMDEQIPENFDPAEWDVIEKPLSDGTTKRIGRRFVVTRVEVIFKKPSELTDDEPLGVSVEEFPLNEAEKPNVDYDPTEWVVVEKTCPDGTKQKFRHRIVVKCIKIHKKPSVKPDIPIPVLEEEMLAQAIVDVDKSLADTLLCPEYSSMPADKHGSKKIMRQRSIKTTITPVGGMSVSVSTEEVPKQTEEIEIDESDPQDEKYDSKEWETVEKVLPDGTVKRFHRRIVETVITTVNKTFGDMMTDNATVRMEEFEIDNAYTENDKLDPSEYEILEKTLPDGSQKRYSRRIVGSALPGRTEEIEHPALWEEIEIDESSLDNGEFDSEEWEVLEKTLPDGSKKLFRRRNLNVITVHKKPIAITAGDSPLCVREVEVDEDMDQDLNLDDWEIVEKTLPDGRKKKIHRKILTTIFSSLNEKNEMIENPPIHIEEVEVYEASSDDEDSFNPTEWEVTDKVLPGGRVTKVRTRTSVTVITPKDTMKLEDKSVAETPVVAEEIELDETAPHQHIDPEEWDIIERNLPDGTTKRFHRRIIRKYKNVPSHEHPVDVPIIEADNLIEVEEVPVEEFELDEMNPDELQKYNTPEWEIVEKTMPDGSVKHFRRKIITTVVTTVTTKTVVVHPDGREEVVDIETTPGEESTLEYLDGRNSQVEEESLVQPLLVENVETGVDMTFDMDIILNEIDQISKSLSDDETKMSEPEEQVIDEDELKGIGKDLNENCILEINKEQLRHIKEEEEKRLEDHNATISSIFSIDDDEYQSPKRRSRDHDCAECNKVTDPSVTEETFEFTCADIDFGKPTEGENVRTASVIEQQKLTGSELCSSVDESPKVLSLDMCYLKGKETEPIHPHSAGVKQDDVFQPHADINAEILYTLRDVSEVEQGEGGFVQAIKERHDKIASKELRDIQHDAEYPTHTVYNDTRQPDINFSDDYVTVIQDPGVEAGAVQIFPVTESYIMQDDMIHDFSTKSASVLPNSNRCQVTTYTMPTEVITKTITIEDDSSTMSREELQEMVRRAGSNEDILDMPNLSSTHVVSTTTVQKVITGKTITVIGDDETELQKAINEAVKNATNESDEVDDGTIVLTAIQQYDEDGNVINTEVVGGTDTFENHFINDR